jgi:hypothetical protein
MAFINMIRELHGAIPKLPVDYAKTLINRAWRDVRRQNLWSFLLWEDRWVSPPVISVGTITVTQGSTAVVADATAAAAITAGSLVPTPISQRQLRVSLSGIYNIWAWDPITLTLTLDQPYAEASGVAVPYTIFQCYYPAPMQDFLSFVSVRDIVNSIYLFTDKTREAINLRDPQRTWSFFPSDVVYYQQDQNPASPTYGWPMFELWGTPVYQLAYQLYGVRRGVDLVNSGDVLPPAVGEDCVMALARKYAYEWAEANKGDSPRNVGADFRFLIGEAKGDYGRLFKEYRRQDRETVDNFFAIRDRNLYARTVGYYNALLGTAYPG